jgi:hypothetical protein
MFRIAHAPDGLIELHLDAAADAAETEAGLLHLIADVEAAEVSNLVVHMGPVGLPDLSALAVQLRHLPHLLRMLARIDRIAVLSDQGWVRAGVEIEGLVLPGVDIRGWPPGDEAAARIWARGGVLAS